MLPTCSHAEHANEYLLVDWNIVQGFFASLTAACVALHAILGCCAHHAHDCEANHGGLSAVCSHETPSNNSFVAGDTCHCEGDSHSDQPSHSCPEAGCVSLKPSEKGYQRTVLVDSGLPIPAEVSMVVLPRPAVDVIASEAGQFSPPLGLYLLHHAILI
jgi:hypothetical protein